MHIRSLRPGDESALFAVFRSAVHEIACADYSPEQLEAWAPDDFDQQQWANRIRSNAPFVVQHDAQPIAYGDLQADGYIDQFYVAGAYARRGVGTLLMNHLLSIAQARDTQVLSAFVSRTAQPFFQRFGFVLVEHKDQVRRNVLISNALMQKQMRALT